MSSIDQYTSPTTQQSISWRMWLAVVSLGSSAFVIVTTELAPIGLLSPLATEFGQSEGRVGLIVTAYAWIAALAALLSAMFLGRVPRKPLLVGLMLILTVSCTIATFSEQFSTLLGARMIGALAQGAFWAMIGSIGAQLVPARQLGLATSIIFGGVSVASVLGVPAANLLAQLEGWRMAFTVIAALSLVATLAIACSVPRLPPSASLGMDALTSILKNRAFQGIYLATACVITAHFAGFTFIEPLLSSALQIRVNLLSTLLFVFGIAGIVGNVISGKLIDRHLKHLIVLSLVLMTASVCAIGYLPAGSSAFIVSVLLVGWGAGVAIVLVGFQTWILRLAGPAAMPASAIYAAIFNAAIGAGALLGGMLLSMTSLQGLMRIVAIAMAVSLIPVMLIRAPTP